MLNFDNVDSCLTTMNDNIVQNQTIFAFFFFTNKNLLITDWNYPTFPNKYIFNASLKNLKESLQIIYDILKYSCHCIYCYWFQKILNIYIVRKLFIIENRNIITEDFVFVVCFFYKYSLVENLA